MLAVAGVFADPPAALGACALLLAGCVALLDVVVDLVGVAAEAPAVGFVRAELPVGGDVFAGGVGDEGFVGAVGFVVAVGGWGAGAADGDVVAAAEAGGGEVAEAEECVAEGVEFGWELCEIGGGEVVGVFACAVAWHQTLSGARVRPCVSSQ